MYSSLQNQIYPFQIGHIYHCSLKGNKVYIVYINLHSISQKNTIWYGVGMGLGEERPIFCGSPSEKKIGCSSNASEAMPQLKHILMGVKDLQSKNFPFWCGYIWMVCRLYVQHVVFDKGAILARGLQVQMLLGAVTWVCHLLTAHPSCAAQLYATLRAARCFHFKKSR